MAETLFQLARDGYDGELTTSAHLKITVALTTLPGDEAIPASETDALAASSAHAETPAPAVNCPADDLAPTEHALLKITTIAYQVRWR